MPRDGRAREITDGAAARPTHICMHVVGVARTDQRVLREARALRDAGYEVTIVDVERDVSRPREEELDGLHLRHIFMPSRYRQTRFKPFFLVKQARLTRASARVMASIPADAYHAHDANALLACHSVARRRRKPLVYDAHEIPFVDPHTSRYRLITKLAMRRLRQVVPHCAGVITVSDPIRHYLQRQYGGPLATVVRNAPPYLAPMRGDHLRERLGVSATARIALYQGGIQANRGLDRIVQAGRYLPPDHYIVLMGSGPSMESLRALIEAEKLGDRVKMLPSVPYAELLAWTAAADLGLIVYPLDYSLNVLYCLPNKLFEFLMSGLPVLSSELPAVEEVLRAYDAGQVVTSLEPAAIAQAIAAMLADPEALARMRHNALQAAQRDLCWEVEQHRVADLYASLPGLRQPTSAPLAMGNASAIAGQQAPRQA